MTAAPPPTTARLVSLQEVAEHRVWCPFSGGRGAIAGESFGPEHSCIGPRCAGWVWRDAADGVDRQRQRCHLVPPHFNASHRVRLASRLFPALVAPLQALAGGDGDRQAAQQALLSWARSDWQPEQELPEPSAWQRLAEPYWDDPADTVALDLIRPLADHQRAGRCGLTGRQARSAGAPR